MKLECKRLHPGGYMIVYSHGGESWRIADIRKEHSMWVTTDYMLHSREVECIPWDTLVQAKDHIGIRLRQIMRGA